MCRCYISEEKAVSVRFDVQPPHARFKAARPCRWVIMYTELRLQSGSGLADNGVPSWSVCPPSCTWLRRPYALMHQTLGADGGGADDAGEGAAPMDVDAGPGPAPRATDAAEAANEVAGASPPVTLCVYPCDAQPCAMRHEHATPADEAAVDPPPTCPLSTLLPCATGQ